MIDSQIDAAIRSIQEQPDCQRKNCHHPKEKHTLLYNGCAVYGCNCLEYVPEIIETI